MSHNALIASRGLLALGAFLLGFTFPAAAAPAGADLAARVSATYGRLPLHFEANQGQTDTGVQFVSRGAGYSLYLTAGDAVLVFARPAALRMSLVGAARKPQVSGREELPGKANYFIDKDRSKWRTEVPM